MSQLASAALCHYLGFFRWLWNSAQDGQRLWSRDERDAWQPTNSLWQKFPACCQPGTIPLPPTPPSNGWRVFTLSSCLCRWQERGCYFQKKSKRKKLYVLSALRLISEVEFTHNSRKHPLSVLATRVSAARSKNHRRILLCYTKSHVIFKGKETFIVN